jgi:hypothetical protein
MALTGPPPININFRNDAIGGSASNALLSVVVANKIDLNRRLKQDVN